MAASRNHFPGRASGHARKCVASLWLSAVIAASASAGEPPARWKHYGPVDAPLAAMWSDDRTGATVALWQSPWTNFRQYLRSLDGGRTWTEVHDYSIEVQPSRLAFAAKPDLELVTSFNTESGLLSSIDRGRSWAPITFPTPPPIPIRDLQSFNPADPDEQVYQARGTDAIVVTRNGGKSWRVIPIWLSGGIANTMVDWIHRQVLTGAGEIMWERQSLDAEASWQSMPLGGAAGVRGGTILQSRNEGIHRSTDGGQTYVLAFPRSSSTYWIQQFSFAHAPSALVYALGVTHGPSGAAIYRSANDGQTWSTAGTFDCYCEALSLHVDVFDVDRLMLSTSLGTFESLDGGATFETIGRDSGLPGWPAHRLAFDATTPGRVWTLSDQPARTQDNGLNWSHDPAAFGIADEPIHVFDGTALPGVLFGVSQAGPGFRQNFYRSNDGGSSWNHLFKQENYGGNPVMFAGPSGSLILLWNYSTGFSQTVTHTQRSVDGGLSWVKGWSGVGGTYDVAASFPTSSVFLATSTGLRRSQNGGVSFTNVPGAPPGAVTSIAIDPADANRMLAGYAGADKVPLYRSDDDGATWTPSAAGLGGGAVQSIVFDPLSPGVVYAAQAGQGVFRSADDGRTWRAVNEGLRSKQVWRLQFDPSDARQLFASTDRGVQSLDLRLGLPAGAPRAVEYFHPGMNHYFVTANADEVNLLDAGAFAGWQRTGEGMSVFDTSSVSASNVCRYFATGFAPQSTHFYSPYPHECQILSTNPIWTFEGFAFGWKLPESSGGCASETRPIYRLFNQGLGGAPNHRYTESMTTLDTMLYSGWTFEGDGRTRVFACVPH